MTSTHKVGLLAVILLLAFLGIPEIWSEESSEFEQAEASFSLLDYKMVKCTAAKFIYEIEDETKPAAPLFENMGKHE